MDHDPEDYMDMEAVILAKLDYNLVEELNFYESIA